ncbi:MAG: class I SAM-dependent methyltransferase [candidate division KSB1 bacterium]
MNWKTKALIQNSISRLPEPFADAIYFYMQRGFGGLKNVNMKEHFTNVAEFLQYLAKQNRTIVDATCLEIGTGRRLNVPLGLWLCGAKKIYTVDLNTYVNENLVVESLAYLRQNLPELKAIWGEWAQTEIFEQRLEELLNCQPNLKSVLALTQIEYRAPIDARTLPFAAHSIDYYLSVSVFEHIPPPLLKAILQEAKRVLTKGGLSLHIIDPSDHFSHADESICSVNFLQYYERQWQKLAGNKFAYHNRLRVYDYLVLFDETGLKTLEQKRYINARSVAALQNGFHLNEKFHGRAVEELATNRLDVVGTFAS